MSESVGGSRVQTAPQEPETQRKTGRSETLRPLLHTSLALPSPLVTPSLSNGGNEHKGWNTARVVRSVTVCSRGAASTGDRKSSPWSCARVCTRVALPPKVEKHRAPPILVDTTIASSTTECSGAVERESDVRLTPRVTTLYTLVIVLHLPHRLSRSPLSHVLRHRHGLSSP